MHVLFLPYRYDVLARSYCVNTLMNTWLALARQHYGPYCRVPLHEKKYLIH